MKTVAVWKRAWLPPSETFVRNQLDSLRDWRGVAFGVARIDSVLSRDSDRILFGEGARERLSLALFRLTGRSSRVEKFLRSEGVAVVHAHFGSEAVSIWRQCRALGIPLVVTLHGHDITAGPRTPGFPGWRYRRRLRKMFAYASTVIAVSEFIRERAIERGAQPEKVVVRYIGVPTNFDEPVTAEHGTEWDIVFVGRLSEKKGVSDLLRAVAEMPDGATTRVAIVGSGALEGDLRAYAHARGLRVDFLGHMTPAGVRRVLARARIFVAPSQVAASGDAEGFGLVFLEAALAGLPVVAYRHGGVPEAVVDGVTGILCEEGDVEALGRAVSSLLRDQELVQRMGAAGRTRVVADFDVVRKTAELEKIYEMTTALK
jgi:colanic acid/amylovoran biosynthesis glycosyltransferase